MTVTKAQIDAANAKLDKALAEWSEWRNTHIADLAKYIIGTTLYLRDGTRLGVVTGHARCCMRRGFVIDERIGYEVYDPISTRRFMIMDDGEFTSGPERAAKLREEADHYDKAGTP